MMVDSDTGLESAMLGSRGLRIENFKFQLLPAGAEKVLFILLKTLAHPCSELPFGRGFVAGLQKTLLDIFETQIELKRVSVLCGSSEYIGMRDGRFGFIPAFFYDTKVANWKIATGLFLYQMVDGFYGIRANFAQRFVQALSGRYRLGRWWHQRLSELSVSSRRPRDACG